MPIATLDQTIRTLQQVLDQALRATANAADGVASPRGPGTLSKTIMSPQTQAVRTLMERMLQQKGSIICDAGKRPQLYAITKEEALRCNSTGDAALMQGALKDLEHEGLVRAFTDGEGKPCYLPSGEIGEFAAYYRRIGGEGMMAEELGYPAVHLFINPACVSDVAMLLLRVSDRLSQHTIVTANDESGEICITDRGDAAHLAANIKAMRDALAQPSNRDLLRAHWAPGRADISASFDCPHGDRALSAVGRASTRIAKPIQL